jgi:transcriptional regulator of heat shock response
MKTLVEAIGGIVDGVVVGFLKNDEYYYLWINNLLKDELFDEYQATKQLIRFIEEKRIVNFIDSKMLKTKQMYYTFIEDQKLVISCLYAKIQIDWYEGVVCIIGPTRVDYKKNASILKKLLSTLN